MRPFGYQFNYRMEELDHFMYPKASKEEADAVAWVFTSPKSDLVQYHFKFFEPEPNDVRLKVLHTALCQSDNLHARGCWGEVPYPCCPGHEIIGQVTLIGKQVTTLKVGDLVAVSPVRYSDNTCRYCKDKEESTQMCEERIYLYGEYFGGYCTHVQINEHWAIKIPEALHNRLQQIAPLLCAGITVYAPLKRFVCPGKRCAIIGIGGLGHLGIQFANKLGMKVTAFTTRTGNLESLHSLGAIDAEHSINEEELAKNEGKYDLVISTLHIGDTNVHKLHQRLTKPGGTFVMVGAPPVSEPYIIDNEYIVNNEITVAGSNVGSIRDLKDMLQFVAHYNVIPFNEYYAFEDFNKAFYRMEKENPRYRVVVNVTDWAKKNGFDK